MDKIMTVKQLETFGEKHDWAIIVSDENSITFLTPQGNTLQADREDNMITGIYNCSTLEEIEEA